MRFFNTAGACDPHRHYMLPAAERLPGAERLIERGAYFVVHAPRQTGKTTTLRALARKLTAQGQYAALHFTCEIGEIVGDDHGAAQHEILTSMRIAAARHLPGDLRPPETWPETSENRLLIDGLAAWAARCTRPLVLFFDEIDALRGKSLLAVLRQLRAGYDSRPDAAPWSVVLCGLRDVGDYRITTTHESGGDHDRLGTSSPFNIKVQSLRLGDFTRDEVAALYDQHREETGQSFTAEAVQRAFELTRGQPWLINALAHEIVDQMDIARDRPIAPASVETAKERLILARATHLDSLVARLAEARIRNVIEPIIAGTTVGGINYNEDIAYARDIGLVAESSPIRIANPIYREIIVRVLAAAAEDNVHVPPTGFIQPDGRLAIDDLLTAFCDFWRLHGEILSSELAYHEVAPQLVLMAFLQRIVNGGGYIDREYGVGRGRIDLLVRWPYQDEHLQTTWQREAIELKVWRDKDKDPLDQGLNQLDAYLDRLALDHGTLVIFDRRSNTPPLYERMRRDPHTTPTGRAAIVLRL